MGPGGFSQASPRADAAIGPIVRVVLSFRARSDVLNIHSYLAERSLRAADRMLARFSQRFEADRIVIVRVVDGRSDIEQEMSK